jgi:hypothetical protein
VSDTFNILSLDGLAFRCHRQAASPHRCHAHRG